MRFFFNDLMPHWQKALLVLAFSSALSSCQPPGEKARKELEKAGLPVTAATAVQAATSGTVATLEMLRTAGVDLGSAPDAHSPTPLIAAIKANSGAVALLLGSTAPDKIDGKDELGRTALSYAVASHQTALALEILAKQARPALTNHPEQDVISDAIKQNQPALVAKLIEATPSADPLLTPALATAVACSSTETVKQLIAHQATLPPPTTSSRSLLAVAAEQTNVDILRSLTEAGAKAPTDLSAEGNPLTLAVKTDHLEMAQLLLKAGYHPDTPDRDGGTATGMAASQKRLPLLALFLDHHAAAQPQFQSALIGRVLI